VLAFLFDVTSFPHTPYLLLSLAGLLAAIVAQDDQRPAGAPAPHGERLEDDPDAGLLLPEDELELEPALAGDAADRFDGWPTPVA
jgi:hypothetical protein